VGTLNVFWKEKGYVTPAEYRRFCNAVVPLARMHKLVFENNETFRADVEVANYARQMSRQSAQWRIKDRDGRILREGVLPETDIPLGNNIKLGSVELPLSAFGNPVILNLEVTVDGYSNDWNFYVYPRQKDDSRLMSEILVTDKLDATATRQLAQGGSVLLSVSKGSLRDEYGGNVAVGFSSIFWNTLWTNGQPPHTLGILCDPRHPAFNRFPTDYHSDYQWQDAMSHATAINLTKLGLKTAPIVRIIDDWFTNRSLALVFETRVGKGRLLISGIDLISEQAERPEARQLLHSLKQYMASDSFHPDEEMSIQTLGKIFK
jgi:hypothetical protein